MLGASWRGDGAKLLRFDAQARMLLTDEAIESLEIHSGWDRMVNRSYLLSRLRVLAASSRRKKEIQSPFPWENMVDFGIAWRDHSWDDYESDLIRLKGALGSGSKLAIVVVPFEPQLLSWPEEDRDYVLEPQRKMRERCGKHGIPCLDLQPRFARSKKRLFRDGIHLNEEGHRVAAEKILAFLTQERLISAER